MKRSGKDTTASSVCGVLVLFFLGGVGSSKPCGVFPFCTVGLETPLETYYRSCKGLLSRPRRFCCGQRKQRWLGRKSGCPNPQALQQCSRPYMLVAWHCFIRVASITTSRGQGNLCWEGTMKYEGSFFPEQEKPVVLAFTECVGKDTRLRL